MFSRYTENQEAIKEELDHLSTMDFQYKQWLKEGINMLSDFKKTIFYLQLLKKRNKLVRYFQKILSLMGKYVELKELMTF